jgi:hypothetical protein
MPLKLQQGQVWKSGDEFIRIVRLARLEVGYKVVKSLQSREGVHHSASKKEFCRLLKSAALVPPGPPETPLPTVPAASASSTVIEPPPPAPTPTQS